MNFRRVFRVASGNFLEAYDFQVFGYYAAYISAAFFPRSNEYASLMLTLMTFGAGFLMRPLGAIALGAYIDHYGRRAGLLLTLALMAVGTVSIACTPSYATIGIFAPLLVLGGRLLQGLSAGVEIGGATVYLSEIASAGRKGFFVAWQSGSQQVAVICAALMGFLLTKNLSQDQMFRFGWRIPLWAGCAIIPVLLIIRRSLTETDEFLARTRRPPVLEIVRNVFANWQIVLLGMMLSALTTVSFYMITAYTPTYGTVVLHLATSDALLVTLAIGISNFIWVPVMGALSDVIGRRPLLITIATLALISGYPAVSWLASAPSPARLLTVGLWFSFLFGSYSGGMVVYLTEVMPAEIRTSGWSLSFSLATTFFGGFTPAISTYLIRATGNTAIPGAWLSFAASLGLAALLLFGLRSKQQGEPS